MKEHVFVAFGDMKIRVEIYFQYLSTMLKKSTVTLLTLSYFIRSISS